MCSPLCRDAPGLRCRFFGGDDAQCFNNAWLYQIHAPFCGGPFCPRAAFCSAESAKNARMATYRLSASFARHKRPVLPEVSRLPLHLEYRRDDGPATWRQLPAARCSCPHGSLAAPRSHSFGKTAAVLFESRKILSCRRQPGGLPPACTCSSKKPSSCKCT